MDKFQAPKTLEDFIKLSKEANAKSIPTVISALERQRDTKVKPLDDEIKFHQQMLAYLTDGTNPEGLE